LFGVETEYVYQDATPTVCALAKNLLRAGVASMEDWEAAKKRPLRLIELALRHAMERGGGKGIHNHLCLDAGITDHLDSFGSSDAAVREDRLYLLIDGDQPISVRIGELYEEMAAIHPRLPHTFWRKFVVRGFGRFFRVVDHWDVFREIDYTEEDDDPEAIQRVKDLRASIPAYMGMKTRTLGRKTYRRILQSLPPNSNVARALKLADEIEAASQILPQIDLDETDRGLMDYLGNSYPLLSLHFHDVDSVRAAVDEVMNMAMQESPMPNVIIPFNPNDSASVSKAFADAGVIGKVIALTGQLTRMMPYLDD
jgi:hypothetical protein